MIFIFFGPPGAGKGTQAELLSNKIQLPHLSTGEILRNKLLESDSLSDQLKKILDSGLLVSDDILNNIISKRIVLDDCKNGFILDGYPRTLIQESFLSNCIKENNFAISKIFDLHLEEKIIFERIEFRSNTESRKDDNEETIKTRIKKYQLETKPLSEYYRKNHTKNYHIINAHQKIEMIHKDIMEIIKNG